MAKTETVTSNSSANKSFQDNTGSYSTARKVLICVVATLEAFFVSLIIFGWSSLVYIYQKEGIYAHLCSYNQSGNG